MNRTIHIIANWSGLKTRPDKLDYGLFEFIRKRSKYDVRLIENSLDRKYETTEKSGNIFIVFSCMPTHLDKYDGIKIYWIYDFCCLCKYKCSGTSPNCGFRPQLTYIENNKFDYVWYKYESYITKKLREKEPSKYIKFPHMMFDPKLCKNYHLPKQYDILFYGATYPASYPFRFRLYHLLKKNENKFNIRFLPYTKRHSEKMITGADLNQEINKSHITIATKHINDVLVAKYYEIGLCGSVICGDYPDLEDERFIRNNMIYIDKSMTDREIISIIENALKDKEKLRQCSQNTSDYLSKRYMLQNGLEYFEELIEKV